MAAGLPGAVMRFFVGLAAAVWTWQQLGIVGWIAVGFVVAVAVATFLLYWPILLVLGVIVSTWRIALYFERRDHGTQPRGRNRKHLP